MGSRIYAERVPAANATIVTRLSRAGAILLGKQNLTEFAFGGTVRPPFGQPRNPWNPDHDPGSSSSGSGVATAAALGAASIGEDTGGSVRTPASWCGVVGLRPTWGRVSRHGSFPLCWSMDAAGPITRTVEDAAIVLGAIAGHDPSDPLYAKRNSFRDAASTIGAPGYFETVDKLATDVLAALARWEKAGRPGARKIFTAPNDFFDLETPPQKLLRHDVMLYGRSKEIDELNAFERQDAAVLMLTAEGGAGKSKLLHDWTQTVANRSVPCARRRDCHRWHG